MRELLASISPDFIIEEFKMKGFKATLACNMKNRHTKLLLSLFLNTLEASLTEMTFIRLKTFLIF